MIDQEAFKRWFEDQSDQPNSVGDTERAWHAALAWLRSQGEPVAHLAPEGYDDDPVPLFIAPQPAIPDGWLERGKRALEECRRDESLWGDEKLLEHLFKAMLAAAPEPRK